MGCGPPVLLAGLETPYLSSGSCPVMVQDTLQTSAWIWCPFLRSPILVPHCGELARVVKQHPPPASAHACAASTDLNTFISHAAILVAVACRDDLDGIFLSLYVLTEPGCRYMVIV